MCVRKYLTALPNTLIAFYFKGTYIGGDKKYKNLSHYSYCGFIYIMGLWEDARMCVCVCVRVHLWLLLLANHSNLPERVFNMFLKDLLNLSSSRKRGLVTNNTEQKKSYRYRENNETMQNKHSGIINSKSFWAKLRGFFFDRL